MVETYFKGQDTETPETMKFVREESRKRLIMRLSSSLPWGELERMLDDIKIEAKRQEYENKMKSQEPSDDSV